MTLIKKSWFMLMLVVTLPAWADFECEVKLGLSNDYVDEERLLAEGWKKSSSDDANYRYYYYQKYLVTQLPWRVRLDESNFSFGIDEKGVAEIGCYFGDGDADAGAWVNLPKSGGKFIKTDAPTELVVEGGEYAAGLYSIKGRIAIAVKE